MKNKHKDAIHPQNNPQKTPQEQKPQDSFEHHKGKPLEARERTAEHKKQNEERRKDERRKESEQK
jgi:hypothetical protein